MINYKFARWVYLFKFVVLNVDLKRWKKTSLRERINERTKEREKRETLQSKNMIKEKQKRNEWNLTKTFLRLVSMSILFESSYIFQQLFFSLQVKNKNEQIVELKQRYSIILRCFIYLNYNFYLSISHNNILYKSVKYTRFCFFSLKYFLSFMIHHLFCRHDSEIINLRKYIYLYMHLLRDFLPYIFFSFHLIEINACVLLIYEYDHYFKLHI